MAEDKLVEGWDAYVEKFNRDFDARMADITLLETIKGKAQSDAAVGLSKDKLGIAYDPSMGKYERQVYGANDPEAAKARARKQIEEGAAVAKSWLDDPKGREALDRNGMEFIIKDMIENPGNYANLNDLGTFAKAEAIKKMDTEKGAHNLVLSMS